MLTWVSCHKLSRQIWFFFETFVGEEDNWLPPDNYQEATGRTHRTPHITHQYGARLLSNLDLPMISGISPHAIIERTTNTLSTMQSMEKYRGIFTTGTIRKPEARCIPGIFQQLTAVTWRAPAYTQTGIAGIAA
jgi:hypothetical protein